MQKMRCYFLFIWLLSAGVALAQPVHLAGVINHYAAVNEIDTCPGRILVSDTTGFRPGMSILLIQMQGVAIVNDNVAGYGTIQHLNSAGLVETARIDSVRFGALYLHDRPVNTYNLSGKVQAVTFPVYPNAVVTDTLRPKPWDGLTGGVLAIRITDTLQLSAPVSADAAGFRGGTPAFASNNNCSFLIPEIGYTYAAGNWRGSFKGEGLAQSETGKEMGRGPQANGGGGGNDHNSGGGGGGSVGAGGVGGQNNEPNPLGCHGNFPGLGGLAIPQSTGRLFLGGGGGAGHANNGLTSGGGSGGGIIVLRAGILTGDHPMLSANGADVPTADGDGGGGGGAGGAIWLDVQAAPLGLTLQANGGRGADTKNNGQNRCFGPGGGGSGGRIVTSLPGITAPAGGQPGVVAGSTNSCNGSSGSAGSGANGSVEPLFALPQGTIANADPVIASGPDPVSTCIGSGALFSVSLNPGNFTYQWQLNTGAGWHDIAAGQGFTGFQTDSLILTPVTLGQNGSQFHCVVSRPFCTQITSAAAALTVDQPPSASFTHTVLSAGLIQFAAAGLPGINYTWDFGDGTPTVPGATITHTYAQNGTYTVSLIASGSCGSAVVQQIIAVIVTATDTPADIQTVRIYPNPVSSDLTVDCTPTGTPPLYIKIYGVDGRVQLSRMAQPGLISVLPMEDIPAGPCLIWVQFESGAVVRHILRIK
jgi:hypothetical protein